MSVLTSTPSTSLWIQGRVWRPCLAKRSVSSVASISTGSMNWRSRQNHTILTAVIAIVSVYGAISVSFIRAMRKVAYMTAMSSKTKFILARIQENRKGLFSSDLAALREKLNIFTRRKLTEFLDFLGWKTIRPGKMDIRPFTNRWKRMALSKD